MSFNYSQLDDDKIYPQVNTFQQQQKQPLPYVQPQQNVNYTQQSSTTQNLSPQQQQQVQQQLQQQQQFQQQQNFQQQSFTSQPVHLVNPITLQQSSWTNPSTVEPIVVLICNFLFPGLGHILLGQVKKGIYFMVIFMLVEVVIYTIAAFTGIGIILVPIIFVLWAIYLLDGQLLADRLKRGFPIMHGECGTSWAKPGLSCFMSEPVFCNANIDECPQEWVTKMQQQMQMMNGQQQQQFQQRF